jgi:hypothetical protein
MNEWEKVLILGTDHYVLSDEIRQIYESLGLDPTLTDASFMRISLAMQVGLTKISAPFLSAESVDISSPNEKKDEKMPLSYEQKLSLPQLHFLKALGKRRDYLYIFVGLFEHLQKEKSFMPSVLLPDLFDISMKDPIFFSTLKPFISDNGYRLLAKNKHWKSLWITQDEARWFTGTFQERLSILNYFISQNPQKALELLTKTWKEENLYEKIQFLAPIEKKDVLPSPQLIKCITDDNEPETLQILTRIRNKLQPEDKAIVLLKKELLDCLHLSDHEIQIALPNHWPSNWTQAGLQPAGEAPFSPSKKMSTFLSAFTIFNPSIWNEKLNIRPDKFLSLLAKDSQYKTSITYFSTAILHFKEREWAYHLLRHWIASEENNDLIRQLIPSFLEILTLNESNKLTQEYLLHQKEPLEKDNLIYTILNEPHLKWSETNTYHLQCHLMKLWEKYLSRGFFAFEHYTDLFLLYARRCQVSESINEDWLESLELSSSQPTLHQDLLEIINIRRKLINLFTAP